MIPKVIHHIAPLDEDRWHPVWDRCYPSWLQQYPEPEYQHIIWGDKEVIDNMVKSEFPQYFKKYETLRHIMKIDLAKMVILYALGGMYVDMDFYCFENFHGDLDKPVCLAGSNHRGEIVQNGLIAAEPSHPFILENLDYIFRRIVTGKQ